MSWQKAALIGMMLSAPPALATGRATAVEAASGNAKTDARRGSARRQSLRPISWPVCRIRRFVGDSIESAVSLGHDSAPRKALKQPGRGISRMDFSGRRFGGRLTGPPPPDQT